MSSNIAIKVENLSKIYEIYSGPQERLKQSLFNFLRSLLGFGYKKYYKEFEALGGVSFEVKTGEIVGVIGRNGSGKSTLLQLICGTLNPSSGQISVLGKVAALLELGSGFNPEFSGRENIYLNAALMGLTKEEVDFRYEDIINFAEIGEFIDQPVKTYSTGMTVRLAFSVIAHVDADILVIDEALAVGDAFFTQKCMRFLREFMARGTIFFVSHDTASVIGLCNRAIWLDHGKIVSSGTPKDVCSEYLEAFFERMQGSSSIKRSGKEIEPPVLLVEHIVDQRSKFINSSNLRNDIEIFSFDTNASSFGKGLAKIISVAFCDAGGSPYSWIVGGESISLIVQAEVYQDLDSPIIGFYIKDKLGQFILGDNTFLSYLGCPVMARRGNSLKAEFRFQMPRLTAGDYSVSVAVANGTQMEHVHHHWIHDAFYFKSHSTSVAYGLVGIPMESINLGLMDS